MLKKATVPLKDTPFKQLVFDNWKNGTFTYFDDTRTPNNAFRESKNLMLDQDGIPRPRMGQKAYSKVFSTTPDGSRTFTRFNTDGTKTIINVTCVGGNIQYSLDDMQTYTTVGSYTSGTRTRMIKFNSLIYIYNGVDSLKTMNMTTFVVSAYTGITSPTGLSGTLSGSLAAGSFNNFYKVTATNDVGETLPSSELSKTTNKERAIWTNGTDYIDLSWTTVSGATRYNIYYTDSTGREVYLDSVTGLSYRDSGQVPPNPYIIAPLEDTTTAPKFAFAKISEGKLFACGDPTHPYRVYWTGTGQYAGAFSAFYGGGWIDLDAGGDEIPTSLIHFRTGQGSTALTALTTDAAGIGGTWHIVLTNSTIGEFTVLIPTGIKIVGAAGSNSPDGVFEARNSVLYPSTKGFYAMGSKPQLLNILATDEISTNIRTSIANITNSASSKIAGISDNGMAYWSVPVGASDNNETWVLDLEHGAWIVKWNVGFKFFFQHTDSTGKVHLLGMPVGGTQLQDLSYSFTSDNGTAFEARLRSGLIHFSDDHKSWWQVDNVTFEYLRPRGSIYMSVSGTQQGKSLTELANTAITDTVSATGWGFDPFGSISWGATLGTPSTYSAASRKKVVRMKNKLLNNIQYEVYSQDANQSWALSRVIIEGVPVKVQDPSSWFN
jgi:hypothetical protein